jgi:hypothetical protein
MKTVKLTLTAALFLISQIINAALVFPLHAAASDYYVVVLPPLTANGCKLYPVRVYDDNGTPLDNSDDIKVGSGIIEDCSGNEIITSGEYIATLDNIIEDPLGNCDGAVISIYDAVGSQFLVKGIITINCL